MTEPPDPDGSQDTPTGEARGADAHPAPADLDADPAPADLDADQVAGLTAQLQENEALLRAVLLGVDQQISGLTATVDALTRRVAQLAPAPAQDQPVPAPRAWVDGATASDWQDLADWVDWLVRTYDFQPWRTVLPCWPAHLGVTEELAALRTAWQMAATAGREQPPNDALILWHDRWLHPCLPRLRDAFQQKTCPDKHTAVRPGRTADPDLLATALADTAAVDPAPL